VSAERPSAVGASKPERCEVCGVPDPRGLSQCSEVDNGRCPHANVLAGFEASKPKPAEYVPGGCDYHADVSRWDEASKPEPVTHPFVVTLRALTFEFADESQAEAFAESVCQAVHQWMPWAQIVGGRVATVERVDG
jgi:hypothetical protein